nr:hypothetical protein [Tanacetum cinerariifolium]
MSTVEFDAFETSSGCSTKILSFYPSSVALSCSPRQEQYQFSVPVMLGHAATVFVGCQNIRRQAQRDFECKNVAIKLLPDNIIYISGTFGLTVQTRMWVVVYLKKALFLLSFLHTHSFRSKRGLFITHLY